VGLASPRREAAAAVLARRLGAPLAAATACVALLAGIAQSGSAAPGDLQLALVGNFAAPTYVTAPSGDGTRLFVVEKAGRIRLIREGGAPTLFLDISGPVDSNEEERGLLSMAFAPDYATSGRFYVYYTSDPITGPPAIANGTLMIVEYRRSSANPNVADPASARTVLSIPHARDNHNGGQLQFGPDGYLYIGTGDGGGADDPDDNGQDENALLGKLLRIDPRAGTGGEPYTIPATNPFVGQAGKRAEIWAYGLRNPWRFSFDRTTGDLLVADVGQNNWEEIDFASAGSGGGRGLNFGWDCFEGTHPYGTSAPWCSPRPANHTPPVHEYSHSRGCSITGGYVVRDSAVPQLVGRYVYADFCQTAIWSVTLPAATDDADSGLDLASAYSFGEDACGRVYVASGGGPVHRLQVQGAAAPATCTAAPPLPPSPPPPPPPGSPPPRKPLATCTVPRVIGMQLRRAKARIRRAHCRVGRLRSVRSTKPRNRVLSQNPRPRSRRPNGARVRLTLSRGRLRSLRQLPRR
jgi:glucose/arabinose dehydrogenase